MVPLQQCTDFKAERISKQRGFQSREDFKAERISKQRGFQSREDFKQGGPHYRIYKKADQKVGRWGGGLVV
jgi:hypothetical protein